MTRPRILIACIGNIFLGDDGFGVEVARRMAGRELPAEVRLVDYGIRGFDLAYALLDGYDVTIFVDATSRGGEPGDLYVIEPDLNELPEVDAQAMMVEPHGMNPMKVLRLAHSMGAVFKRILLVGCEPATFGPEEGRMGLSEPVLGAVDQAAEIIESIISRETT
jgi:hydrogenase maturation protease